MSDYEIAITNYYRLKEPKKFKNGNIIDATFLLSKNDISKKGKFLYNTVESGDQIIWFYCKDEEVKHVGTFKELMHKKEIEAKKRMLDSWL